MALTRIDSFFLDLDAIGGITFDNQGGVPTLRVDATTHRVGIGITNPAEKLHVIGQAIISSNVATLGDQFTTLTIGERPAGDGYASITFKNDADNFNFKLDGRAEAFSIWTNKNSINQDRFVVNYGTTTEFITLRPFGQEVLRAQYNSIGGGKVGIGTSNPNALLDVRGSADTDTVYNIDLWNTSTAANGQGSLLRLITRNAANTSTSTLDIVKYQTGESSIRSTDSSGFLTFHTGGFSERVRIDSSGRLLVGTSTARSVGGLTNQVQIEGVNAGTYSQSWVRNIAGTGGPSLFLGKSRSGSVGGVTIVNVNDNLGGIYFCGANGVDLNTPGAAIESYVDGTPGASDMPGRIVFSTTADGSASLAERMRITSDGKLGLGTSTISKLFHVQGSQDLVLFEATDAGATGAEITLQHTSASPANNDIISRINFSGRDSGLNATTYTRIEGIATDVVNNQETGAIAFSTRSVGTFAERMRLTGTGLGIGTTSPNNNLEVRTTGVTTLQVAYTGQSSFTITEEASGESRLVCGGTGSFLTVHTGSTPTERARIDSSGRLLVGTSTNIPGSTAIVQSSNTGGNNFTGARYSTGIGGAELVLIHSKTATVGSHTAVANNDYLGSVQLKGSDGSAYIIGADISAFADGQTWASGDCPGRLVFSTTADGASSPMERMRIDSAGQIEAGSLGTAAAPVWSFLTDPNTGIYSPGADQVAISTNGTGRLFVDASGRVLLGTTTEGEPTADDLTISTIGDTGITIRSGSSVNGNIYFSDGTSGAEEYRGIVRYGHSIDALDFWANAVHRTRITSTGTLMHLGGGNTTTPAVQFNGSAPANSLVMLSDGKVGLGISAPSRNLQIHDPSASNVYLQLSNSTTGSGSTDGFQLLCAGSSGEALIIQRKDSPLSFWTNNTEKARIDSSGRLLVGTPASTQTFGAYNPKTQIEANGNEYSTANGLQIVVNGGANSEGPRLSFCKSRGSTAGSFTAVANGDTLGLISFMGANGSNYSNGGALISAQVDGEPFTSGDTTDLPGRLVFSTTADGAASPMERMRIGNDGTVYITQTSSSISNVGHNFLASGRAAHTRSGDTVLEINRLADDGTLVNFRQADTIEGSISVSGTTVSYNGAHLSRWSQLPGGAERTEILRGTVLSNIDEMCNWGNENNEQLNRMKVSDVEGDKNVAGVFQAWDDDDDTYTDDFYCAMTGDFIIRIAEGVTVQRGDLLMSAGDGTAKPQGDDIVRSKTVAKVTSTHVTCIYDDGSYCVPCVLMAC